MVTLQTSEGGVRQSFNAVS